MSEVSLHFQRLRIDELILPFMNGELLNDRPVQYANATIINDTIRNVSYQVKITEDSSWNEIFMAIDKLLIQSGETMHVDLVGLIQSGNVLKPQWA